MQHTWKYIKRIKLSPIYVTCLSVQRNMFSFFKYHLKSACSQISLSRGSCLANYPLYSPPTICFWRHHHGILVTWIRGKMSPKATSVTQIILFQQTQHQSANIFQNAIFKLFICSVKNDWVVANRARHQVLR